MQTPIQTPMQNGCHTRLKWRMSFCTGDSATQGTRKQWYAPLALCLMARVLVADVAVFTRLAPLLVS
eukprot:4580-Pleurochrysis_carterae.AAC.1